MIEEATVDCYNESEQATGLLTMIEEHLALPFETLVLGVRITVDAVDLSQDDRIVAICVRDQARQAIRLLDLPLAGANAWRRGMDCSVSPLGKFVIPPGRSLAHHLSVSQPTGRYRRRGSPRVPTAPPLRRLRYARCRQAREQ